MAATLLKQYIDALIAPIITAFNNSSSLNLANTAYSYNPTVNQETPTTNSTYTSQKGQYWLHGNVCEVQGNIVVNVAGTGSGDTIISLPFPTSSTNGFVSVGSVGQCSNVESSAGANATSFYLESVPGSSYAILRARDAATFNYVETYLTNAAVINFQIKYIIQS